MSDTPQTDAFENLGFLDQQMTWMDFARQLERQVASTQHLLHESLAREDRFYRELAAANEACRKASLDALHMRDDFLKELAAKDTEKYCYVSCAFFAAKDKEASK